MRVFITGVSGYIGSYLALALNAADFEVTGLDAFTNHYSPSLKRHTAGVLTRAGVRVWELDLVDGDLSGALEGVDAVVHFAAQPGISSTTPWEDYVRNNNQATHRLVEAAKRVAGVRFVNISTSSVYGLRATGAETATPRPASWYGSTKLAAEQEVMGLYRGGELSACSLRLFSVFGERERPEKLFPRLIRSIARGEAFPLFEGSWEHRRSFTYVGDICSAIRACLENWDKVEGEIFNVGTDKSFTTGEAIELVQDLMGKRAEIRLMPKRAGDQDATHANIGKIRGALGYEARFSLGEGLERMVEWYRGEVHGRLDWA